MLRLNRDVCAGFGPGAPGYAATYPKGTEVIKVVGGCGGYAIRSEKLVRELTHNAHDARCRWVFVPADAVEIVP